MTRRAAILALVAGCAGPTGTDDTDPTRDTPTAATWAQGVAGDETVDIPDGVALAAISNGSLKVYIGEGEAACPSMQSHPGDHVLQLFLTPANGAPVAPGTYTVDDATLLEAYTGSYNDTCGGLGGATIGGGDASITLTRVDDVVVGTFSIAMYRTTPAPENVGVFTGAFEAPMCDTFGEGCAM